MPIEEDLACSLPGKELDGDTLLTIGVFDGVHLGHKHLLSGLKERAKESNLLSGVVTFNPPPQKVLAPQAGLLFLTDVDFFPLRTLTLFSSCPLLLNWLSLTQGALPV